jgi:hypothetical protein
MGDTDPVIELTSQIELVETWQSVPYPLPSLAKGKLQTRRDPADVTVFLVHQTGVRTGFGTAAYQVARIPAEGLTPGRRRDLAREARYRSTPYHSIFDPKRRASIVQWPVWAYMSHGNGGNRASMAWALDGLWPGDLLDIDLARDAMRHSLECGFSQGAKFNCVESHAQHSFPARAGDPGAEIWRGVVLPVAAEFKLASSLRTTGTGKIPSWQR